MCFGSSEKGNKILTVAIKELKCGAETEGKAMQRLPYLGIHPINSHQTLTLLWTTRSAYQKEHVMVVSGGACQSLTHTEADASSQPLVWGGSLMEELEGGPEELKGFTAPWEEQR